MWPMHRQSGHALIVNSPRPDQPATVREYEQQQLRSLAEAYKSRLTGTVPEVGVRFAEAIRIRLECHDGRWWCVFDPFTWIDYPNPGGRSSDCSEWRNERWARRYNRQWARIINEWSKLLVQGRPTETLRLLGLEPSRGIDAAFTLHRLTAWSSPSRLPLTEA